MRPLAALLLASAVALGPSHDGQPRDRGPAEAQGPAAANRIAHLSFYSYLGARPPANVTNLALSGNLSFLAESHILLGVRGMVLVESSQWSGRIFAQRPHGLYRAAKALRPGWEAAVDEVIAALRPLSKGSGGWLDAVMLGDELVCAGLPLANLSSLAGRLRAGLTGHGVLIFTNECFAESARVWPAIPDGLDAISLDKRQIWLLTRMVRSKMLERRKADPSFDRLFAELGGADRRNKFVKLPQLQHFQQL